MRPLLTINEREFPDPDEYKLDIEPLGVFERNANGRMVGDLVAIKKKINCTWKLLQGDYFSELIEAAAPFFISVKFLDTDGEYNETKMYATMQSGKLAFRKNNDNWWDNVTFCLMER